MSNHFSGNPEDFCCSGIMSSPSDIYVRDCLRLLWLQHVYWTRMVITGIAFGSPDLEATTNRLLRNADDFGRLFRQFYGPKIAAEVRLLIRDHLTIAAELVKAAKAGNTKAAAAAEKRWYENADEIAAFLNHINPCWSQKHMKKMWHEHLALTKDEAVAQLNQNYIRSIEIFNKIECQALMMAEEFACGIIEQFDL